ncbi:hypothetical protein WJX72_004807 [[Myrmecia] bisecta]|uniref:EF-hand domain-containing protein n=1 Tax=[Myrmecia] bisecta TaxID=41462 RepID=A0AAW1P6Z5_9CHLO
MPGATEGSLPALLVDEVIRKMGDTKAERLSANMVLQYTQPRLIVVGEQRVFDMFDEADYKQEGTVSRADLIAAATGRYPKRQYGQKDWLDLLAVVAGWPLERVADYLQPPCTSSRSLASKHGSTAVRPPTGEWATFVNSPLPASPASSQHPMASLSSRTADEDSILIMTGGIKSMRQIEAEEAVNQQLMSERKVGFESRQRFQQFADGLQTTSTLTAELGLRSPGKRAGQNGLGSGHR